MSLFKYFFREKGASNWLVCDENLFDHYDNSPGHESKTVEFMVCEEHGEYEVKSFGVNSKAHRADICPKCAAINHFKTQEPDEDQKLLILENMEAKMRRIGISKRLMNLGFDDFNADTDQKRGVLAKCKAMADDLLKGKQTPSWIFNGGVGTGKTLLATSIAKAVMHRRSVKIITAIDLFQEIKDCFGDPAKSEPKVIKRYSLIDLLVIDEVGVGTKSDFEVNALFRFIKARNDEVKPTILISNLGETEFCECVDKRTRDRMREDGGKMISFDWSSFR